MLDFAGLFKNPSRQEIGNLPKKMEPFTFEKDQNMISQCLSHFHKALQCFSPLYFESISLCGASFLQLKKGSSCSHMEGAAPFGDMFVPRVIIGGS
jgi:hypothetical protein